jgi:hypothetical protein
VAEEEGLESSDQRVCGTGGREKEDVCARVGFLVRGRSEEEEEVREGEGRGLMLLLVFQSGRSRGCC